MAQLSNTKKERSQTTAVYMVPIMTVMAEGEGFADRFAAMQLAL